MNGVDAPLWALIAFAVLLASLLHPRIFRPLSHKLLKPFGAHDLEPLPAPTTFGLLLFYCGTWIISGFAVWFMLLSLGTSPSLAVVAFLGGVSAVGAIVAVLAFFAPSGLGAREASMYGLLLAVTERGARTRRDGDEPVPDHGRRGGALRRRPRSPGGSPARRPKPDPPERSPLRRGYRIRYS